MRSTVGSYDLLEKLGQGSYGLVYKGRQRNSDNKLCVIKEINLRFMDPKERSDAVNEGQLLKSLNNQYIVKYYDMFIEDEDLFIAMEYCENGDLLQYLSKSTNPLPENKIWQYFLQMLIGLDYMHSRRILHRDFKTMNMFLTNSYNEIRIGDLGVAKRLHSKSQLAKTIVGTPYFLSPEICEEKPYSEKSDVWSLGCIVYEMATLKHPFEANNHQALLLKILKNKPDPLPSTISRELQTIVNLLLTKDQSKRPDTSALLKEPSIKTEEMKQI